MCICQEAGHFRPRAVPLWPADLTPPPKNYLYRVGMVLKNISRSFPFIKKYLTFFKGQTDTPTHTLTQTDRQTHALPSIK